MATTGLSEELEDDFESSAQDAKQLLDTINNIVDSDLFGGDDGDDEDSSDNEDNDSNIEDNSSNDTSDSGDADQNDSSDSSDDTSNNSSENNTNNSNNDSDNMPDEKSGNSDGNSKKEPEDGSSLDDKKNNKQNQDSRGVAQAGDDNKEHSPTDDMISDDVAQADLTDGKLDGKVNPSNAKDTAEGIRNIAESGAKGVGKAGAEAAAGAAEGAGAAGTGAAAAGEAAAGAGASAAGAGAAAAGEAAAGAAAGGAATGALAAAGPWGAAAAAAIEVVKNPEVALKVVLALFVILALLIVLPILLAAVVLAFILSVVTFLLDFFFGQDDVESDVDEMTEEEQYKYIKHIIEKKVKDEYDEMVAQWRKDISSRNNDTSKNKWGLALEDAGYATGGVDTSNANNDKFKIGTGHDDDVHDSHSNWAFSKETYRGWYPIGLKDKDGNYLDGTESYFDSVKSQSSFNDGSNNGQVDNIGYLVAGYNISRCDMPISNSHSWIASTFQSYKWDITRDTLWTDLASLIGIDSYFEYSVDDITETKQRTVSEYEPHYWVDVVTQKKFTLHYSLSFADVAGTAGYDTTYFKSSENGVDKTVTQKTMMGSENSTDEAYPIGYYHSLPNGTDTPTSSQLITDANWYDKYLKMVNQIGTTKVPEEINKLKTTVSVNTAGSKFGSSSNFIKSGDKYSITKKFPYYKGDVVETDKKYYNNFPTSTTPIPAGTNSANLGKTWYTYKGEGWDYVSSHSGEYYSTPTFASPWTEGGITYKYADITKGSAVEYTYTCLLSVDTTAGTYTVANNTASAAYSTSTTVSTVSLKDSSGTAHNVYKVTVGSSDYYYYSRSESKWTYTYKKYKKYKKYDKYQVKDHSANVTLTYDKSQNTMEDENKNTFNKSVYNDSTKTYTYSYMKADSKVFRSDKFLELIFENGGWYEDIPTKYNMPSYVDKDGKQIAEQYGISCDTLNVVPGSAEYMDGDEIVENGILCWPYYGSVALYKYKDCGAVGEASTCSSTDTLNILADSDFNPYADPESFRNHCGCGNPAETYSAGKLGDKTEAAQTEAFRSPFCTVVTEEDGTVRAETVAEAIKRTYENLRNTIDGFDDMNAAAANPSPDTFGDVSDLANIAAKIIMAHEGSYSTVSACDNGCISIGAIQFNGSNAAELLKRIYVIDKEAVDSAWASVTEKSSNPDPFWMNTSGQWITHGGPCRDEHTTSMTCSHGVSSSFISALEKVMALDAATVAQQQMIGEYVESYIQHLNSKYGMTDCATLVWCADICNQYGCGGFDNNFGSIINSVKNANPNYTLDDVYTAWLASGVGTTYKTRRQAVYHEAKGYSPYPEHWNDKSETGGSETVKGNGQVLEIHYYCQGASPWATMKYSSSTIGESGCGPTSCAIVASTFFGDSGNSPKNVADWAAGLGMYVSGAGSKHEIVPKFAQKMGMTCKGANSPDEIITALNAGSLVIVKLDSCGPYYTGGGHFCVVSGYTEKGTVIVSDCGKSGRSAYDTGYSMTKFLSNVRKNCCSGGKYDAWILSK